MLVNVYSYLVMEKSVSCCCVHGRRVISNPVTYYKASRPVSIEIGDTVFVKTQPKFKPDHTFHGPFRVYEVTDTNVKVKPVTNQDAESRTLPLQQVSKCKGSFATNQSWLAIGHNITKSIKWRKVRKQNPRNSSCNANPDLEQTVSTGYRTQYRRTVHPPKRF